MPSRAVGRVVLVAEHLETSVAKKQRLHGERDQIEAVGPVLADACIEARPGGVEIRQAHRPEPVGLAVPPEDPLDGCLRLGVHALGANWRLFGDWDLFGSPYTAHDDENTTSFTPASTSSTVLATLCRQCFADDTIDSPTDL